MRAGSTADFSQTAKIAKDAKPADESMAVTGCYFFAASALCRSIPISERPW
jgi:hypothetical protein